MVAAVTATASVLVGLAAWASTTVEKTAGPDVHHRAAAILKLQMTGSSG